MKRKAYRTLAAGMGLAALCICGCGKGAAVKAESEPARRTEDMSWGPVEMVFELEPARIRFDRDVFLTVRIATPSEVEVKLPALHDRFAGFAQSGEFADDPVIEGGKRTVTRHFRLTPLVADEYRIAPIPVQYVNRGVNPPEERWFPTRPIVMDLVRPEASGVLGAGDIKEILEPVWIWPAFRTVLLGVLGILVLAGVAIGIGFAVRRVRETVRVLRMSPRERALRELAQLLARDLIGKHRIKDFYVELTMVVRRYIERSHGVRAPEQTTEEFLAAVADDARFSPEVVRRLRAFLQSADLVKFAAYEPGDDSVQDSVRTAKAYIEADADGAEAAAPSATTRKDGG